MTATLILSVVSVSVLVYVGSVSGNQNDALASLLSRMNAIEGRVSSLNNRVASLESRLSQSDGEPPEPEPTEFKIVNLTRAGDRASSQVTFTLHYEAEDGPPQFLLAVNPQTPVKEVEHGSGPVTFSVPSREISPILHVRTHANTLYQLVLITHADGPMPDHPEEFPNVIMSTSPNNSVKFREDDREAEITITTHVTGTGSHRQVTRESMAYYAYALHDNMVDQFPYVTVYEDNLRDSPVDNDDNNNDINSGGEQRLRLLQHERDGNQTRDVVKLDGSRENSGVLFVEKHYEFSCQSCVLYGVAVAKALPYYLDNGEYFLPQGALVAYKDLFNMGPSRPGPRYFRFVRVDESEMGHTKYETCQRGQPCLLQCWAFGDYPEVFFDLFNRAVTEEGVYYDQVGNMVLPSQSQIHGWSAQVGMEAFSFIRFDEVRPEHAGRYECLALNSQMGTMLKRTFILTVQ